MDEIICADAVKWARKYSGEPFHALLCDPPYHLTSIVKRFGKDGSAPAQFGKDGAFSRASAGFMGKQWDGGDVAFHPETWAAFMSVLHPGAFGMAFASSRGWHRLACAIEDGGFIIHPSIFGWAYGSGFPKATRIDTQIDKAAGAEREKLPEYDRRSRYDGCERKSNGSSDGVVGADWGTNGKTKIQPTAPATDLAKAFAGYRYGLQALKPALEPIIVFQKPYEGRPLDNIVATGAGVLNINGARIGTEEIPSNQWVDNAHPFGGGAGNDYKTEMHQGRWPANFILLDDQAAQALDRQSGILRNGGQNITSNEPNRGMFFDGRPVTTYAGDTGGASRFFFRVEEQIDAADPVYYEAKASREERDAGLDDGEILTINDGRKKSIDNPYQRDETERHNPHPTVKPLALTRYLATLLLPPAEYAPRRLFVPFAGVGSEMIGAFQAGWEDITGVELTEEYIPINEARRKYWKGRGWQVPLFPG